MLSVPSRHVTDVGRQNLDRFCGTSAALELESDPRSWVAVAWSWAKGPPMHVTLRNDLGEWIAFVMDERGHWRMTRLPIAEKIRIPGDIRPSDPG
jgi:hypothetical protein